MACSISCAISFVFLVGMIYFYNATSNSEIVKNYKDKMTKENKIIYDKISKERLNISYQGYALGLLLSVIIILYNKSFTSRRLSSLPIICVVIATSALTNYFYYTLYPKSDSMLNYVKNNADAKEWYSMYKEMQYNYHLGFVLGIIAVGFLGFAFRC
jgi:uncharacterized protein YacL